VAHYVEGIARRSKKEPAGRIKCGPDGSLQLRAFDRRYAGTSTQTDIICGYIIGWAVQERAAARYDFARLRHHAGTQRYAHTTLRYKHGALARWGRRKTD
jgi:hypothetical protein